MKEMDAHHANVTYDASHAASATKTQCASNSELSHRPSNVIM